jgi:hypothetical protein
VNLHDVVKTAEKFCKREMNTQCSKKCFRLGNTRKYIHGNKHNGMNIQKIKSSVSEKGIRHVHCNASLLVSVTAGKNCGKETGFRSLSIDSFSLSKENQFSAIVCHVVLWAAFFHVVFLS